MQESLGVVREEKLEQAKQLVLENLNPTTQEKLQIMKNRVEDYLERRKQIFWDLTVIMQKKNHPELFINEKDHLFGQFEDQVFNRPTDIRFGVNFNYELDFSKRDTTFFTPREKKALKLATKPYNPDSDYGHRILDEALSLSAEPVHLILKPTDKLKSGQKGRLELSLFTINAPEHSMHLISTIIGE